MTRQEQRIALGVELTRKDIDPEDLPGCVADTFGNSMTTEDMREVYRAWKAERSNLDSGSVAP